MADCYYAARPGLRPRCERIAVVRYGRIALCAACDREKSTAGKAIARGKPDARCNKCGYLLIYCRCDS